MKINSILFLDDYKHFKKGTKIIFNSHNSNKLKLSILAGRNGSGKTTIMSLIAILFHNLERYIDKIPASFELNYEIIKSKEVKDITIRHIDNIITIKISDLYKEYTQLVPKVLSNKENKKYIDKKQYFISYNKILEYLPSNIILSTFSLHGEYPTSRPWNYSGDERIIDISTTKIYGKNHYYIGAISIGILELFKLFNNEMRKSKLLKIFDLKITNRILIYNASGLQRGSKFQKKLIEKLIENIEENKIEEKIENIEENKIEEKKDLSTILSDIKKENIKRSKENTESGWITMDNIWIEKNYKKITSEEIYLNDIEFKKNGREIRLHNMSSGEKMLLLRTISILSNIKKNSLVIIEEPELHLDPVWNKDLMYFLELLYSKYDSHLIIATHNHSIINSVKKENLIFLDNGKQLEILDNTFLAPYDELFSILYGDDFSINQNEKRFLDMISKKSLEDLKKDYNSLGNSIYKYLVFKEIKNRK